MYDAEEFALMWSPSATPTMADWDRVAEAAGDLMERLDMWPERWRVTGLPEDGQFASIKGE